MKNTEELKKWLNDKKYLSSSALRRLFKRTWLQTKTLLVKFRIKPQAVIRMGQHSVSFYKRDESMRAIRFLNTNPQKYISVKQISILWGIHPYAINKIIRDCGIAIKRGSTVKDNICHQSVLSMRPSDAERSELQQYAILVKKNRDRLTRKAKEKKEIKESVAKLRKYKDGTCSDDYYTVSELSEAWGICRGAVFHLLMRKNVSPSTRIKCGKKTYHKSILSLHLLAADKRQENEEISKHERDESLVTIPRLMTAWNLSKSFVFRALNNHGITEKFKIERLNGQVVLFYDKAECEKIMPFINNADFKLTANPRKAGRNMV
jgi:hypothetical protein